MASIHRQKSPYWFCEFRSADGRWLKRSTKLKDRKKALEWCFALQAAQDAISRGSASEAQLRNIINQTMVKVTGQDVAMPSVREWLQQWLEAKEGANTSNTLTRYRQSVADFLKFLGQRADGRLESVRQRDVIDFRKHLREQGKSASTINLVISRIVAAPFRQAFSQGLIRHNPMAGIPRLSERGGERKQAFTVAGPQASGGGGRRMEGRRPGHTTGARGPAVSITLEDIDSPRGVITFVQARRKGAVARLASDFEAHLKGLGLRRGYPLWLADTALAAVDSQWILPASWRGPASSQPRFARSKARGAAFEH
jgi:hypothetical protein